MQLTLALSAALMASVASAAFTVSTPSSLVQCQPYLISWTGGTAPFYPAVTKAQTTSDVIESFPMTSAQTYSWTVNQAVGDTFTIVITDSTGASADTAVTPAVVAGSSSACLTATTTTSSAAASSAGSSSTTSSASSTKTSAASSGANMLQTSSYLVAGAVGVVVAALV
ncbi:hypothetical protein CBS101457_001727 [Exobasidium rhododendri]|nr:hypothetical protein CBS101457_001727 [Exobasidium rhododendri]